MHKTLCCNGIGIVVRARFSPVDELGKSASFGPAVPLTRKSRLGKLIPTLGLAQINAKMPCLRQRRSYALLP